MGQRGPVPGPKAARGSRPTYTVGVPRCPAWLGRTARAVWKRTVRELTAAGTAAVIDGDVIAAYASAVADLEAVSVELDRSGVVVEVETVDRNGKPTGHTVLKPNPLLKAKNELLGRVRQLADALGIGPVSRARVSAGPTVGPEPKRPNEILRIRDDIARIRAEFHKGG